MREYTDRVIRCAITNLGLYEGNRQAARKAQLKQVERWVVDGVELIQVREKDMEGDALFVFAEQVVRLAQGSSTKVIINSRADVALAAGAQGVHLTADPNGLRPAQVREVFAAGAAGPPLVSVSCHTVDEVAKAVKAEADLLFFGPVFEKRVNSALVQAGLGLEKLNEAVRAAGPLPVLALGGITAERIPWCEVAGAAGIAAIRFFSEVPFFSED